MKTHPRRLAALLLLSACCLTHAAIYAATMASQPWVTNRIAEAEARTDAKITAATNATDVTPGNYETVSNRAMSARGKTDLEVYAAETTPWTCSEVFAAGDYSTMTNKSLWTFTTWEAGGEIYPTISYNGVVIGDCNSPMPDEDMPTASSWGMFYDENLMIYFSRHIAGMATGNRLATTNDIPRTPGAVGAYPAASGSALESGKQDRLPYPTNAIPYAAISGAPSGGPEWRVVEVDANTPVSFVTNGIAAKIINGELYASAAGWPDGAAMFVRGSVVIPQYEVDEQIRLVGYGTWPTNNFQSVWWRSGATIYVNILVEE